MKLRDFWPFGRETTETPEPESHTLENPSTPFSYHTISAMHEGLPTKASVQVNEISAFRSTVVFACVRVLAETIASLPWHIYKHGEKGKEIDRGHPLYTVLHDEPNEQLSSFAFREAVMANAAVYNRCYIWKARADSLLILPTHMTRQIYDDRGRVAYEFTNGDYKEVFPAEEIIHIPGLSLDGLTAIGPIMTAAKEAIGLAIATEEHNARFFSNGARLGGILTTDGELTDVARERIRVAWTGTQAGLANAYKTAVLEGGLKWQAVGMQSDHAQLAETRRMQVEEICRVFRMPPSFVQDHTRSTFANVEHQDLHFSKHTIAPWCKRIEQEFNRKLFKGSDHFCEFNLDGLQRGDFQSRTNGYAKALGGPGAQGYMTINEVRALENLPPITGGDKLIFAEAQAPKPKPEVEE
jgi:HK97 family phage portal protein